MRNRLLVWLVCIYSALSVSQVLAGQEGLLGSWSFDEGQGDLVVDGSGNENDGEVWDAEWVKGEFGTALSFNGQGASVSIPEIGGLDGSEQMTVEAWVYWEGTGRYPNIISGGTWSPGGFLMFVNDNQCAFRMGRPGFSASDNREQWREVSSPLVAAIAMNRWYHLAATFKRPHITTYVNGQPAGSATWDYPVGHKGNLVVGKWAGTVSHEGLIDEVRIFNRALDAKEIAASYDKQAARRGPTPQGQKAYETIPRASQLAAAVATFENDFAKIAISPRGRCTAFLDKRTGKDHILRTSPLVTIKQDGSLHKRALCSFQDGKLTFRFDKPQTTVTVAVETKPAYFVFRVDSVSNPDVEEVTFLHFNLSPCQHVHAMSGLASDDEFGVCLRTLNLETYVSVGRNPPLLTATGFKDHGLEKAGAALVACPPPQLRPILQNVMRDQGIPHSELGGPFSLDAPENRGSYVFASVSEKNVDQWIDLARRGGIRYVHLSGWGQSLGHYTPRENLFPHGLDGLKAVTDKLHEAGLKVGIHTLTGCISPHDPWVTPVPDPRLATDGTFTLTADLSETDASIPTAEPPGNYPTVWAYSSRGNCIRIDDELIFYSAISNEAPYGFFECRRGAFGTKVAAHKKDAAVHHMIARYGCFIPDEKSTLVDDIADAIANVYNTCGMDQIYMDGAEAMRGWYGIARMRLAIFERLKRPALVEASCWGHHSWPFHSRVGAWDHPKWGLKRFADDHLRAVEQYRRACLLEAQLGWWVVLGPARDWDMEMPDEIEYLCAKALAHDTPLSFQGVATTSQPANARQDECFTIIGRYEQLRLANYFTDAVKEKLREERQEFRLTQTEEGAWQVIPTDYMAHKMTGLSDRTNTWAVTNRYADQPVKLRIQALYSAFPYDDPQSLVLANFSTDDEFSAGGAASRVSCSLQSTTEQVKASDTSGCFKAANKGDSAVGAWARVIKQFDPVKNMTPHDAIGLWVHGDGKGELLNLQLTNLPEYFRTLDDHHIKVDFKGWRYFELLMRERDAAAYHDYKWPYGAHCVLHRSPLVRHVVSKLTAYLNNLPPDDEVTCYLSPIKALRTQKTVLRNPAIEIEGKRLVFPVDLESGMYIEFESPGDCRLYDERGRLLQWLQPQGDVPRLVSKDNTITLTCQGTEGFRSRAEVTVITEGLPLSDRNPADQIDWSLLRRQYESPHTIRAIDGQQNQWQVLCRPEAEPADLEIELRIDQVAEKMAAYDASSAVPFESFDDPEQPAGESDKQRATYVYDSVPLAAGCSPGVTQKLSRSSEIVKFGDKSACYSAVSTRDDNGGWSVKYKRMETPVDLSGFKAIGFWLHGDGNGQQFKLQLHDADGGYQDMYTRVSFIGWRYCQFDLGGPRLKDPSKIVAMNLYYNGIPAGRTVTCYVDEVRLLRDVEPLRDPAFTIAGQELRFPVAMNEGDRLVFKGKGDCRLYRQSGTVEDVKLEGSAVRLRPGRNPVVFSLPSPSPSEFRAVVSLVTVYPR